MPVPADLVVAAIRAAQRCRRPVAEVSLGTLAAAAGISRSTLVRRIGGSRRALDEAVRRAGVDPGGQPVRERAIAAGARLISERGLAAVTLESVAAAARCSVPSLHAIFGTRHQLFAAIYERYSPLTDLVSLFSDPTAGIEQTVAGFYQTMVVSLTRQPRIGPAMLAELLAGPHGPAASIFAEYFPRALSTVGGWLQQQVLAGRIRDLPIPLLMEQLVGPILAHSVFQSATGQPGWSTPNLKQVCEVFTTAFLNAVARKQLPKTPPEQAITPLDCNPCQSQKPLDDARTGGQRADHDVPYRRPGRTRGWCWCQHGDAHRVPSRDGEVHGAQLRPGSSRWRPHALWSSRREAALLRR